MFRNVSEAREDDKKKFLQKGFLFWEKGRRGSQGKVVTTSGHTIGEGAKKASAIKEEGSTSHSDGRGGQRGLDPKGEGAKIYGEIF